jgi:hypothetical protein
MVPPSIPEMMPSATLIAYRSAAPMARTKARKIVITQLSRSVDEKALEILLRSVTPSHSTPGSDYLVKAEFVYHQSGVRKGERKDHALAYFEDATSAKKAIQILDGYEFQGRRIMVKLAKEGAEPLGAHREEIYQAPRLSSENGSLANSSKTVKNITMRPSSYSNEHIGPSSALKIGIELSRTPPVIDGSSPMGKKGCTNHSHLR